MERVPACPDRRCHRGVLALRLALVAAGALWSADAAGCTVTNPSTNPDLGSFSPAEVKGNAVPVGTLSGGINCTGTAISLLGGNTLTGTLGSADNYRMMPVNGGEPVTFKIYLDQAATRQMSPATATNFLNPQVIDLVGLLGNSPSNIPVYVKASSTNPAPAGSYTGTFTIAWVWKFCSGTWVGSSCTLGVLKQGAATATIKFTLTVAAKPVTAIITSQTTWDPVSGTNSPKALPLSKRRVTITLNNPDIVAVDAATLVVNLPTASRTQIALDGDGTNGQVIQSSTGSSGLLLSYAGPAASSDDVEFSSDQGATFTYAPVAGDMASQAAVTTIRFKPRGSMAAGSSFTMSVPYTVR
ncbi:spore coat protein U domain-containing protein [Sphingomonas sp. 1P08PE]|uniref:spore coat protein U domain-containing protein n=1 Tax=Sphingomonas sp. 1P08PE TaxID=554122 RepID=UPI0039A19D39